MPVLLWTDVAFCWLAMALHLAWCSRLDPKLARTWLWASVRATVQLALLGYLLLFLFEKNNPLWTGLALTCMILVSAWTVTTRAGVRRSTLIIDSLTAIVVALAVVLIPVCLWGRKPVYFQAPFVLPFVGILLGNSLSGLSLGIAQWHRELQQRRGEVELWLALGARPREAVRELQGSVMRTAMTVVLNAMAVAGIVSIPGMMTGQLIAGGSPENAVRYQLVILFLISSTVFVSVWVALRLHLRRAFDAWGAFSASARRLK